MEFTGLLNNLPGIDYRCRCDRDWSIDAINMTAKDNIDLVLIYIRMPLMDGYEAAEEICKVNNTVPIVARTAYALSYTSTVKWENSIAACTDGYIFKPIDPGGFLETIIQFIKPER